MRARSFSHVGITVSDFNKAVRFYWDVFGCPLVGVADTPPERVRTFFGVEGTAPSCKIGWIRVPGGGVLEIFEFKPQRAAGPGSVESGRPHAHLVQRPWSRSLAPVPDEQGGRLRQQTRAISARPLVLLREGLRRQPDRVDGPWLHVLRPAMAGSARRLAVPARDVQAVTTA